MRVSHNGENGFRSEPQIDRHFLFDHDQQSLHFLEASCLNSNLLLPHDPHLKVCGLLVVEDVALSVVGGRAAGGLVSEGGTPLDGQGLVRVHEGLADGEGHSGWACN